MLRSSSRVAAMLALALVVSWGASARARKQRELPYGYAQVWSTTLRLLRVDLKLAVTDRDAEGGFVLFEYVAGDKAHPGSIELVTQGQGPRAPTVAIVQVQGQPSYVEQMILDRLEKKLRAEFGAPLAPEKPARPPPTDTDAGGAPDADAGAAP